MKRIILLLGLLMIGCINPQNPRVDLISPQGWINTSNVTLVFRACDASDPLLDCLLQIDNGVGNVTYVGLDDVECKPTSVNLILSEGVNTISLSCTDDAGHTGSAEPLNLWIDTQAPTVEWLDFPG